MCYIFLNFKKVQDGEIYHVNHKYLYIFITGCKSAIFVNENREGDPATIIKDFSSTPKGKALFSRTFKALKSSF